jgi:hypothetical protein
MSRSARGKRSPERSEVDEGVEQPGRIAERAQGNYGQRAQCDCYDGGLVSQPQRRPPCCRDKEGQSSCQDYAGSHAHALESLQPDRCLIQVTDGDAHHRNAGHSHQLAGRGIRRQPVYELLHVVATLEQRVQRA